MKRGNTMKRLQCENGDKFGYWTVIDNTPIIKSGHAHIKVQCKCNKVATLCLSDLIGKRTTRCKSCKAQGKTLLIKIGDVYKDWIVINGPKISHYHSVMWEARCRCCDLSTRWLQGNELTNPNKCFCCQNCAAKKRGRRLTKRNGRVGDLTKEQHTRLKNSAKTRNINFNVSIEFLWNLFILQKSTCAITGDIIDNIKEASLDRKDSNLGYTEENVQWVTKQANLSKHIMSQKDFISFCQKVLNYANQQPSLGST